MNSDDVGAWIALAGLVIAAAQLAVGRTERRTTRDAEQALRLAELRSQLVTLGAPAGSSAHKTAEAAHQELLDAIQREVATSTAIYVMRVGKNRGSFLWGSLWLAYGLVAAAALFLPRDGRWPLGEMINASTASAWVLVATLALVAVPIFLAAYGFRQILSRLQTRAARKRAGVRDDVSVEAALEVRDGIARLVRSRSKEADAQ